MSTEQCISSLDYEDLNFATSSERLGLMHQARKLPFPGIPTALAQYLRRWWLASRWEAFDSNDKYAPILAFAQTLNQFRAVEHLRGDQVSLVGLDTSQRDVDLRFPLTEAYACGLKHWRASRAASELAIGYQKLGWRYFGHEYMLTPGLYIVMLNWLREMRPQLVVVSNDHSMRPRVVVHAARELGIPSVYLQHASVTSRFPPLTVDYAFLDGRDALDKYLTIGPTSATVFLAGSPLHDSLIRAGSAVAHKPNTIGICINRLDDAGMVSSIVNNIRLQLPGTSIQVRIHPADKRNWARLLPDIHVNSAADEPLVEFFRRISYLLAGDSNVHLEAAIFGLQSGYWSTNQPATDHYGFAAAGLVKSHYQPEKLVSEIAARFSDSRCEIQRSTLCRYSATLGTPWHGRSGELIKRTLATIIQTRFPDFPDYSGPVKVGEAKVYAVDSAQLANL